MSTEAVTPDESTVPVSEPTNADVLAAVAALHHRFGSLMTMVANLGEKVQSTDEFVNVLKGMGESLANAKGMQATMLRNMIPGLDQLGGQ